MKAPVYLAVVLASLVARASAQAPPAPLDGDPIWAANTSAHFAMMRTDFNVRATPQSATLFFAARGSPRPPEGTTQAKLLGAAAIYVNSVFVAAGPGHNVPTQSQVARAVDLMPFVRVGPNALGIASFFDVSLARTPDDTPRVHATLIIGDANGVYTATSTGTGWTAWTAADSYFNPTGNAGISWYPIPNEYLDARARPLGWAAPDFNPGAAWPAARVAAPWPSTPYLDAGVPPLALIRTACAVRVVNASRTILDYGQEFMGGVNLSFTGATSGARVTVTLAEELMPGGASVRSPARTGNAWRSTWTLSGNAAADSGLHHHEFVQFRYAQIDGVGTGSGAVVLAEAGAWVIQHPAGGAGINPWEKDCSRSVPAATAFGAGAGPGQPLGAWSSDSAALDAVFNFSAYTIVATSLDVNVDGQTRERDVDAVDAANTAMGQYYIFGARDFTIQRRTLFEMLTNDTGMWSQCVMHAASSTDSKARRPLARPPARGS